MKKAFTLAEVLIVVSIVSVVAAITMPQFITSQFEDQMATKLTKVQGVLGNAIEVATRSNGMISDWGTSVNNYYKIISPNLKIDTNANSGQGAFADKWTFLSGSSGNAQTSKGYGNMTNFTLTDGTAVGMRMDSNKAFYGVSSQKFSNSNFLVILVDLNGKKGPNVLGRDMYFFVLADKGLIPAGIDSAATCVKGQSGSTCTAKFLNNKEFKF